MSDFGPKKTRLYISKKETFLQVQKVCDDWRDRNGKGGVGAEMALMCHVIATSVRSSGF